MDVSGLTAALDVRSAPMLGREDLARVHTAAYLDRFAALSAGEGGDLGFETTIGPGGYDIARVSAGLAAEAVDAVVKGEGGVGARGRKEAALPSRLSWPPPPAPLVPPKSCPPFLENLV